MKDEEDRWVLLRDERKFHFFRNGVSICPAAIPLPGSEGINTDMAGLMVSAPAYSRQHVACAEELPRISREIQLQERLDTAVRLLKEFVDGAAAACQRGEDDGECQAHGFVLVPGEECPMEETREFLDLMKEQQ